ncbi:hypothetical protein ACTWJ8_01590 [Streptomyces sp. SDT5-1]|uniref:hypothetical protein n=1 Tax=Streptomyces sp. SDT5-1 TaxID=3406418 RepID=UPI003FD01BEC
MTVFYCAKCSTQLTGDLEKLPEVPDAYVADSERDPETRLAPSTVPMGRYAIDPKPWGAPFVRPSAHVLEPDTSQNRALLMPPGLTGAVSTGPRNSVIVHPKDVPSLRLADGLGIHSGCCGPLGTGGRNMACGCGTLVATLAADCLGPHELHLDPIRVYAHDTEPRAARIICANEADSAGGRCGRRLGGG